METLLITIISALIAAFLGAIGYFLKMIFDDTRMLVKDMAEIKPKVDILWKDKLAPSHSPRQLNEQGANILGESGIKEIIDEKKDELLRLIKTKNVANAYDAERAVEEVTNQIPELYPDLLDVIKDGAFKTGSDIDAILFVGSIYLRNQIFAELGFSVTDLDGSKNS